MYQFKGRSSHEVLFDVFPLLSSDCLFACFLSRELLYVVRGLLFVVFLAVTWLKSHGGTDRGLLIGHSPSGLCSRSDVTWAVVFYSCGVVCFLSSRELLIICCLSSRELLVDWKLRQRRLLVTVQADYARSQMSPELLFFILVVLFVFCRLVSYWLIESYCSEDYWSRSKRIMLAVRLIQNGKSF